METEETLVKNVSRRKLPEDGTGRRQGRLGSQKTQQRRLSVEVNQQNRPVAAGAPPYPGGPRRTPVWAEPDWM